MTYDVCIVGAGVVGGMLARELSRFKLSVCLVEKENDVACGASKANSGIIHGGFDPEPGTLKAQLNTAGIPLLYRAAQELNVPHKNNGSIVCAFSAEEDETIKALYQRGLENGITALSVVSGDDIRAIEPNLSDKITSALISHDAGIICPYALTIAAVGNAMDNGAELKCGFSVCKIENSNGVFTLTSESGESVSCTYLVNCAGGFSDRIAELAGNKFFNIIPRAGEYMVLDKAVGDTVSHTIFQVPSKEGKGILVSPTADGNLLVGPTASRVETPEARQTTPHGLDMVTRLSAKSVPSVDFRQVITSFTGVRASQASGDFIIKPDSTVKNLVHVAAIDSPGLTCCVSIAHYVIDILKKLGMPTQANPQFNPNREGYHTFKHMSLAEKNAFIKENPLYGKIVCRCEGISQGEISAAILRNPPATDIDGVKRRTRSGMGRCQGGFCAPQILRIIHELTGAPIERITKNGEGSEIVIGKL